MAMARGGAAGRRLRRTLLAGFILTLLVSAVVTIDAWRHPRLPHLFLVEPSDEVWEEFGLMDGEFDTEFFHRGPVVAAVAEDVAKLGIGNIRPGNVFWKIGGGSPADPSTNPLSISELKHAMREHFGERSMRGDTVRVVYHLRKPDGSVWSNTQHLLLNRWQRFLYLFGY